MPIHQWCVTYLKKQGVSWKTKLRRSTKWVTTLGSNSMLTQQLQLRLVFRLRTRLMLMQVGVPFHSKAAMAVVDSRG